MSDYPMLISNKLHSFRNFAKQKYNSYICSIQTLLRYLRYMFYVT